MTTPPDLDLTALMKIAERATPGPWTIEPPHAGFSAIYGLNGDLIFGLAAGGEDERLPVSDIEANAAFLDAFSPSSVLAILTRLAKTEARVAVLEGALASIRDGRLVHDSRDENRSTVLIDLSPGEASDVARKALANDPIPAGYSWRP